MHSFFGQPIPLSHHMAKNFFLIPHLNLLAFSLKPFPLLLSLHGSNFQDCCLDQLQKKKRHLFFWFWPSHCFIICIYHSCRIQSIHFNALMCPPETESFPVMHFPGSTVTINPVFLSVQAQSISFCVSGGTSH